MSACGSLCQPCTDNPLLSLSVISGLSRISSWNSLTSDRSHKDQSISPANGEIVASDVAEYSAEQRYSMVVSLENQLPWANPGGIQTHSAQSTSGRTGMLYATMQPNVREPGRMSS